MAIKTFGIDHIHVNVRSMDRFRDLMKQLFDLDATRIGHIDSIQADNATVRLRGTGAGQPFLDVFESGNPRSPINRLVEKRGPCVSFISFRVENIEEAAAHATRCGLQEISRVGFAGVEKQVQYNTMELLGFNLEFVEHESGYAAAIEDIQRRLAAGEPVDGIGASREF